MCMVKQVQKFILRETSSRFTGQRVMVQVVMKWQLVIVEMVSIYIPLHIGWVQTNMQLKQAARMPSLTRALELADET